MPESNPDLRDVMLNLYSRRQDRKTHDYIMAMSVVINVMEKNRLKGWIMRAGVFFTTQQPQKFISFHLIYKC